MKKIFLGVLAIALTAAPAFAEDGGKKKAKKNKAKTECVKDKCCDPQHCDPKCCDLTSCQPKEGEQASCAKEAKCSPAPSCTANK